MRIATIAGALSIATEISSDRLMQASRMHQVRPPGWRPGRPANIGDWFINEAILRTLDFDDLFVINGDIGDAGVDYVNETCDALILKGGNYLDSSGRLSTILDRTLLERLRIPIIPLGAGVQARPGERIMPTADDAELLRMIHSTCAASSVRGGVSAQVLAELGIHNVVVTGCPTLFWNRSEDLSLRTPSRDHAAFTFRQSLFTDDLSVQRQQFAAIEATRRAAKQVTVALQGEEVVLQDLFMARRWRAEWYGWPQVTEVPGVRLFHRTILDTAGLEEQAVKQHAGLSDPATIDWLLDSTFFSWDVADYLDFYRTVGLATGCRLHGNLMALVSGCPTHFITYDRRTEEIAELLRVPRIGLNAIDAAFDPYEGDWTAFSTTYRRLRNLMISVLELNGLRHTLGPVDGTVR